MPDIGDPEEAMREGVRSLLKMHYPKDVGVRRECSCGQWHSISGSAVVKGNEWSDHVATVIVKAFPPASLEVTDSQARIEEALGTLTEWAEGRRGFTTEDPARDAIADAMVTVKYAALVFGLTQSVKAYG